MKRSMPNLVVAITVLAGLPAVSRTAAAQGRLALELAAGPAPYDLSGTGTGTSGAAFLTWRKVRGFLIQPGVTVFSYRSQFDERTTLLLPELSIQGELVLGSFRPFLGGGGGAAFALEGARQTVATLHAVGGARVDLSDSWGLVGEMRMRAVQPWTGHTVDFLFGISRALQRFTPSPRPVGHPADVPVDRIAAPPGRFEMAGHLGVHVDRAREADRGVIDDRTGLYAAPGEASAFAGRLGYWPRPTLGVQLGLSRSSNASWEGSAPVTSEGPPGFANRTTYLSARAVVRTSPERRAQLFAAAGPALMLYGGTGENLRTNDIDLGGVLEIGTRLRATQWLGVELALSNYFYRSRYYEEGTVFRHDLLILPGLVVAWH